MTKCYYCLCSVCNMARCPHGHNRFMHCFNACYRFNRRLPILDCDYFEHTSHRKAYRIKRKGKSSKVYTNSELGTMLEAVLNRLDIPQVGTYEVLYDGCRVALKGSYSEAEKFAEQFSHKVKIRKVD